MGYLTEPQSIIAVTVSLIVIISSFITIVVKLWPVVRKTNAVLNDLSGEKARPGVPARPGVMERLQQVEKHAYQASFHSRPNNGTSSHDKLMGKLEHLETQLNGTQKSLEHCKADRKDLWYKIQQIDPHTG